MHTPTPTPAADLPDAAAQPATPAAKQLNRQASDFTAEGSPVPGSVSTLDGAPAKPRTATRGPARRRRR